MTLHAAIQHVLTREARAMSLVDIATIINRDALYRRQDGQPVQPGQIALRVRNYGHLFSRNGDVVLLNSMPSVEAQPAPAPALASTTVTEFDTFGEALLDQNAFRPAGDINHLVPDEHGLYAIRLREGARLPDPFGAIAEQRATRLIYLGEAQDQTLPVRLVGNELRAKGNGTFFRSLGAVLGFRPGPGSLAGRARQRNYRFSPPDRDAIVDWINQNLDINWVVLSRHQVHDAEVQLIQEHTPLLNLRDNPRTLMDLSALRRLCRDIAAETPAI